MAIKKWFDPSGSDQLFQDFREEVMTLAGLRHPNVLQFLGAVMKVRVCCSLGTAAAAFGVPGPCGMLGMPARHVLHDAGAMWGQSMCGMHGERRGQSYAGPVHDEGACLPLLSESLPVTSCGLSPSLPFGRCPTCAW